MCLYSILENAGKACFFVYPCFETHNFRVCGTPGALLDKHLLTPHILDAGKARFVLIILVAKFSNRIPLNLCFIRFLTNTKTCTVWKLLYRSLCSISVQLPR